MIKKPNQSISSPTKNLLLTWKPGQVLTSKGLRELGVSKSLASYLKQTGTLAAIGDGAFRKANETVSWSAAVEAMEHQLGVAIHAGGRTALELQGTLQYASLGAQTPVWLFVNGKTSLPKWFSAYDWGASIYIVQTKLFKSAGTETLRPIAASGFTVTTSRRERGIMEMIHLIGKHHRFEEVTELFEGLTSLDPAVVQELLLNCTSKKVRRIFLYLARESGHAWFSKLDEQKIDLGKGKREVIKGGQLDYRYLITVPRRVKDPDV